MHPPSGSPPPGVSFRTPVRRLAAGSLGGVRRAIDQVDDAIVVLAGLPVRDGARETGVLARARRLAARVHVPGETSDALMRVLISDACRQQVQAGSNGHRTFPGITMPPVFSPSAPAIAGQRLLRLLPPPARWQPLLRRLPTASHAPLVARVLGRALARLDADTLEIVRDRRLGIAVTDLGLAWVLCWRDGRLQASDGPAEASVRGSATDLMLLASRMEDADTLFFQRRLVLTGDTELGLTVRNLLDRLPWQDLPLAQRIALQRGSRLLRAAREQYHAGATTGA